MKRVTKSAGLQKKKQSGAPGPRLTNRAEAVKRAEVAAVKKRVRPAHGKAEEKAAERRSNEPSLSASRKTRRHDFLTGIRPLALIFDT